MSYNVRPMQDFDITQVSEIDREAFPTQYPPPNFKKDLNKGVIRYLVAFDENGAPGNQTVAGKMETETNSSRRFIWCFQKRKIIRTDPVSQRGDFW